MSTPSDHAHCKVCGRVAPAGAETCSRACREEREQRLRTRRNYTLMLYAAIALILVVFASTFLRG
jgi:predicted nucleic acid-binding Zn ribbon protein